MARRPRRTIQDWLVWLEAYDQRELRQRLRQYADMLADSASEQAPKLLHAIVQLDLQYKRAMASRVTAWYRDLPEAEAIKLARIQSHNLFQNLASLACDGEASNRYPVLARLDAAIATESEARSRAGPMPADPPSHWLASYCKLVGVVHTQARNGARFLIVRRCILGAEGRTAASGFYTECARNESAAVHSGLFALGHRLLETAGAQDTLAVPEWAGGLLTFAVRYGGDRHAAVIASQVVDVVSRLGSRADTRVGRQPQLLLSVLSSGVSEHVSGEAILRAVVGWLPRKDRIRDEESSKFSIHLLRFLASEPCVAPEVRQEAAESLLALVQDDRKLGAHVFAAIKVQFGGAVGDVDAELGLVGDWQERAVMKTFLTQVWRATLNDGQRARLAGSLTDWGRRHTPAVHQELIYALLRVGANTEAERLAKELASSRPEYGDGYALLAICHARAGRLPEGTDCLRRIVELHDKRDSHREPGVHTGLVPWLHEEMAAPATLKVRWLHLVCAALARERPLEDLEAVGGDGYH